MLKLFVKLFRKKPKPVATVHVWRHDPIESCRSAIVLVEAVLEEAIRRKKRRSQYRERLALLKAHLEQLEAMRGQ